MSFQLSVDWGDGTPIRKGNAIRPSADPSILKIFSSFDFVRVERIISQNGMRVIATAITVTVNNGDEIEFGSPFLATTAPKSLKKYPK